MACSASTARRDQIAEAIAQRAGDQVNIAIAETADAAILAARNFPGVTVAPDLNDLDVSTLPLTEEMAQVLESWGIYTLEQLAQLPETRPRRTLRTAWRLPAAIGSRRHPSAAQNLSAGNHV